MRGVAITEVGVAIKAMLLSTVIEKRYPGSACCTLGYLQKITGLVFKRKEECLSFTTNVVNLSICIDIFLQYISILLLHAR